MLDLLIVCRWNLALAVALIRPWIYRWSNRLQPGPCISHWGVYKDLGHRPYPCVSGIFHLV